MFASRIWIVFWLLSNFSVLILCKMGVLTTDISLQNTLSLPSILHPFGFDSFGRDLFLLCLKSSGVSVCFAICAVFCASVLSLTYGVALALSPEWLRFTGQRVLEFLLAFPSVLLALAYAAIWGPGWDTLLVSLFLGIFPSLSRLVFVRSRDLMGEDYVKASFAFGGRSFWIARIHCMPALLSLMAVKFPNLFAHALLAEATLSFLGVGAPIGSDTWGSLLALGSAYPVEAPHITMATVVPLVLTLLAFQILSERKTDF